MMTYSESIDRSLGEISGKIETYSGNNTRFHEKCDYIEILALLSSDELYKSNLLSRFFAEYSDRDNNLEERQAEISDDHEQEIINLFEILKFRNNLYLNSYPFIITNDMIKLKDNLTFEQKLYIILLCCANLTTFEPSLQYKLTDEFEHITYCAIKKHLPNFIVKKLGSNSDYAGNTINKLKALGKDINLDPINDQIEAISPRANKEKGVDLVAWYKFNDNLSNTIIFFIQCACGKDTQHKQHEPEAYKTYFNFKKLPIISLSTPKSVVIKENSIQQLSEVAMGDILFFDRSRLIELIIDGECVSSIEAFNLADRLISETISVLD